MRRTPLKRKTPLKRGPWRRKSTYWFPGNMRQPMEKINEARGFRRAKSRKRLPFTRKTPTELQRRTWMKKESDKRKIERKIYEVQSKRHLQEHPLCQLNVTCGRSITRRDIPGIKQIDLPRKAKQVHHTKGRGIHYLDTSTYRSACLPCHEWENSNRNKAVELGLRERVR
jgi:hypothetical protein